MRSNLCPAAALIATLVLLAGAPGCTMCPDPFDYSGPVADGGAAQNDFGARSNGILPLRAAPTPWPPVVSDSPAEAEEVAAVPLESVLRVAGEADATSAR